MLTRTRVGGDWSGANQWVGGGQGELLRKCRRSDEKCGAGKGTAANGILELAGRIWCGAEDVGSRREEAEVVCQRKC